MVGKLIRQVIMSDPELSTIFVDRVYPVHQPDTGTQVTPYAIYLIDNIASDTSTKSGVKMFNVTVALRAVVQKYSELDNIVSKLIKKFTGTSVRGPHGNIRVINVDIVDSGDLFDPGKKLYANEMAFVFNISL